MTCRYTLKIGNLYLAPRPSITVIENDQFESITPSDSGGGCENCGGEDTIDRREIILKLRYKGRGSLATAWHIHSRVEAVLNAGCEDNKQIGFERRVCDENFMRYNIRTAWQEITDNWTQFTCDRILTVNLHLILVAYNVDDLFDFGDGPFSSSFSA